MPQPIRLRTHLRSSASHPASPRLLHPKRPPSPTGLARRPSSIQHPVAGPPRADVAVTADTVRSSCPLRPRDGESSPSIHVHELIQPQQYLREVRPRQRRRVGLLLLAVRRLLL